MTYFCYTTNVKLNKGSWNGDKRLKHGQFSSDNEECLADSKEMAVKYPDLTKAYCKYSTARIQAEFIQAEYIEIIKIGIEE